MSDVRDALSEFEDHCLEAGQHEVAELAHDGVKEIDRLHTEVEELQGLLQDMADGTPLDQHGNRDDDGIRDKLRGLSGPTKATFHWWLERIDAKLGEKR